MEKGIFYFQVGPVFIDSCGAHSCVHCSQEDRCLFSDHGPAFSGIVWYTVEGLIKLGKITDKTSSNMDA
jgi:hypothetical protein